MVGIIEAHSDSVERAAYKLIICEHIDVHSGTEKKKNARELPTNTKWVFHAHAMV